MSHLKGRKAAIIFDAFKSIFIFYIQRSFRIQTVHADGEFRVLKDLIQKMPAGTRVNLTSEKKTRSRNRATYLRCQRDKPCISSQSSVQSDPKTDYNTRHTEHHEDAQLFSDETRHFFGAQSSFYSQRRITEIQETFDYTAGTVLSST